MRYHVRFLWLGIVAVLAVGSISGFLVRGIERQRVFLEANEVYGNAAIQATRQLGQGRIWRQANPQKLWEVGGQDFIFYGPLDVDLSPDGNLFVTDWGDLSVKEFSPDSQLISIYGGRTGQGPGEFLSITDLSFRGNEEVWIADDSSGIIIVFNRAGDIVKRIKLDIPPYRVVSHAHGGFLAMMPPGSVELFGVFDEQGILESRFGRIIDNQKEKLIALDGWIEDDRNNGFVYSGLYAGLLARFDSDLRLDYLMETIDPTPIPRIHRTERRSWVDYSAHISAQKICISNSSVYLLSPLRGREKGKGALDVYDLKTGRYRFSLRLPGPSSRLVVAGEHIYTVSETKLTKWFFGKDLTLAET